MTNVAYVQTMLDRRGNIRGYAVFSPINDAAGNYRQHKILKRYEKRTYMSLKLCLSLAEGLRDSLNGILRGG